MHPGKPDSVIHYVPVYSQRFADLCSRKTDLLVITRTSQESEFPWIQTMLKKREFWSSGHRLLMVLGTQQMLQSANSDINRLSGRSRPPLTVLGNEPNASRESSLASARQGIILSTCERLIDHIRRNNFATDLPHRETLVFCPGPAADDPGWKTDFDFVLSRFANKPQIICFFPQSGGDMDFLINRLNRPRVVSENEFLPKELEVNLINQYGIALQSLFLASVYRANTSRTVFVVSDNHGALTDALRKTAVPEKSVRSITGSAGLNNKTKGGILLYSFEAFCKSKPTLDGILFFFIPNQSILLQEALQEISHSHKRCQLFLFTSKEDTAVQRLLQELPTVKTTNYTAKADMETIKEVLDALISRIQHQEDPQEMNHYKKMFKKTSIFMRSYLGGFLLKQYLVQNGLASNTRPAGERPYRDRNQNSERPKRDDRRERFEAKNTSQSSSTATDYTAIFISIGKNRRVYPRDLLQLVSSVEGMENVTIGEVKVFDSYSFVEVPRANAAVVIDCLQGKEFRGKKLAVNYAKKRDESSQGE